MNEGQSMLSIPSYKRRYINSRKTRTHTDASSAETVLKPIASHDSVCLYCQATDRLKRQWTTFQRQCSKAI